MKCISKKVYLPSELIDDFSIRKIAVKDHTCSPLFVEYFASIASVLLFQSIHDTSRSRDNLLFVAPVTIAQRLLRVISKDHTH